MDAMFLGRDSERATLDYEGWSHFSQGRDQVEREFHAAGDDLRLCWLEPGAPAEITV